MSTIVTLCVEFFLTGLFAVGGGLATLPFLTQMGVRHPEWFSPEMLVNMVAISESTPGPIGVNMATYVGYTVAKLAGAVLATLFLVLPSLILIMLIAKALKMYRQNPLVNHVFLALRPVVTGLIASSAYTILKLVLVHGTEIAWLNAGILAALFMVRRIETLKKLHPIVFILVGAVLGIVLGL